MKAIILFLMFGFLGVPVHPVMPALQPSPTIIDKPTQVHVIADNIDITTSKVTHLDGVVDEAALDTYMSETINTSNLPGPRVIIINSPGGYVDVGDIMIAVMEAEKAMGVPQICIVTEIAHSMAFNLLTHCDVRLVKSLDVGMVVHKIRGQMCDVYTAAQLRKIADIMEAMDEPYRQANAMAMGLSLEEYDAFADAETRWTASDLIARGYLNGVASITTH